MDKFIKLLDKLIKEKNKYLCVHITYFISRKQWSITVLEDNYEDFVVKVEDSEIENAIRLGMKQLIKRYLDEVIDELLLHI